MIMQTLLQRGQILSSNRQTVIKTVQKIVKKVLIKRTKEPLVMNAQSPLAAETPVTWNLVMRLRKWNLFKVID